MVNAVSFSTSEDEVKSIRSARYLKRQMQPQDFSNWIGVDYLILCSGHIPMWIAKIEEIAISRRDENMLKFMFSEIRDVWGKSSDPNYASAYKPFQSNRDNPKLTSFEDNRFFTIGDVVPFTDSPDFTRPLTINQAADRLAETYSVEAEQIEIIIRNRPKNVKES
ncbi:hypothetical protein [Pseudomonas entomophila]|uniref:hypothetical protein n=1 Tax=Pseudomonas entomophila TaxID=312306 RepID=UPI001F027D53|nr:hypothetical protein [Pseudomonas entomophila]MCG8291971.1 hypothetical protein [Pseudomonas entomophila]